MTDSMGPGKLVRHMQNPSYTYDEYLICIGLGPCISSVICKNLSYSGPSYPSSPVYIYIYIYLSMFLEAKSNLVAYPVEADLCVVIAHSVVGFGCRRRAGFIDTSTNS